MGKPSAKGDSEAALCEAITRPIIRGKGTTESERYLARLADTTFLELWSYPNTFIDKRGAPGTTGKELADLLVICGDDVIIFSDKSIAWPETGDIGLRWARWYRRAVEKSVNQIRGAERWLRDYPDRIFLDPHCSQRLPIELPPEDRRRVHGVAVALGAQPACRVRFGDPDGSLKILSALKGRVHTDINADGYMPFALGDVDPEGSFVHVFDKPALDIAMREFDTISDFVRYLIHREQAIRGEVIYSAASEADLIAMYVQCEDEIGRPFFPRPEQLGFGSNCKTAIPPGEYDTLVRRPEYRAKKKADAESYAWDRLIRIFMEHIIAGTSVGIDEPPVSASNAEQTLRNMARENRLMRRALGRVFVDTLRTAEREGKDRFVRVVLPNDHSADPKAGYLFLVLAYPTVFELKDGYAQYRRVRVAMLNAYCASVLYDNRHLRRMTGIAMDASGRKTEPIGGSEDLLTFEVTEWTPEFENRVEEHRRHFDVLDPSRLRYKRYSEASYPRASVSAMSRQQRRALERKIRKQNRKTRGV